MIEYLYENRQEFDISPEDLADARDTAIQYGQLDTVKYLTSLGVKYNPRWLRLGPVVEYLRCSSNTDDAHPDH